MAILDKNDPQIKTGSYQNITIYYLNGQLIARSICRKYKKKTK